LKLKTIVIIMSPMEGSSCLQGETADAWPPRMTRCECAEIPFDEVARCVREEGLSLEEVSERTGCGRLCTACLPDLRHHLAPGR
jgi:NAD(P)H-nitrite reductase large subunit